VIPASRSSWLAAVVVASACQGPSAATDGSAPASSASPTASTTTTPAPAASSSASAATPLPIDARGGSVEVAEKFAYQREASADLDGDGSNERVVLAADVTLRAGEPLWEDGHRWAVWVVPPNGARTLLYAAFVPNGSVDAAVVTSEEGRRRRVLVQETTPQSARVFVLEYQGAGKATAVSRQAHDVATWLHRTPKK
jgi:hypothetical protein